MESLKQFKKYSSTIAGIIYVAYSVLLLATAEIGSGTVTTLALLGAGVCCFIPKSQSAKGGFLALVAVLILSSTLRTFFGYINLIFKEFLDFAGIVSFVGKMIILAIRVFAAFLLAAFILPACKKHIKNIEKIWFVPAILEAVSVLINTGLSYSMVLFYDFSANEVLIVLLWLIPSVLYVVGQAAMGISAVDDDFDNIN